MANKKDIKTTNQQVNRADLTQFAQCFDNAIDNLYTQVRPSTRTGYTGDGFGSSVLGLRQSDYDYLYRDNRIFQAMVNLIPQDANTEIPHINGTEYSQEVLKELKKVKCIGEPMEMIDILGAFTLAGVYGRLYGDGFIFMNIDDGLPNSEPIDFNKIRSVKSLIVKDRYHVSLDWHTQTIVAYQNYASSSEIENSSDISERYHYTRVIRLMGVSEHGREYFSQGYNKSVLDGIYNSYLQYFSALRDSGDMLNTHSAFKYGLKGLAQITRAGKSGYVKQRFEKLLDGLGLFKGLVYDADTESADFIQRSYSGVDSLLDHLQDWMIANSGMPRNKVFGNASANALSEGSEGDRRTWNEIIHRYQHEQLRLGYSHLIKAVLAGMGQVDEYFELDFPPYYKMTKTELADYKLKISQIDKTYVDMGLPLEYVLEARFGGGSFSHDLYLEDEAIAKIIADKEAMRNQIQQASPERSEESDTSSEETTEE